MPRGRPREFDHDQALDAAMEQFWTSGYERTGLSELEACTGLGRQSLYNAFGDKRALFEKTLRRYQEHWIEPIVYRLEAPGSPLENVHAVLDLWEGRSKHRDKRGCLMANSIAELGRRDAALSGELAAMLARVERAFERAFRRAIEMGELDNVDPKAMARLLTTLGQGLSIVRKVRGSGFTRDAIHAVRALFA